ncbi:hypothetical protein [Pedobacter sp. UBA5917]|jgi:hypothetical protein|uniref:hypothetical protein n=1 Tax=Pedobacter sp. UBA5917 TaxID=1947061 RepID=UPI0025D6F64B|nr:hypothetical protein [Pedobacter sp. UBA5917]
MKNMVLFIVTVSFLGCKGRNDMKHLLEYQNDNSYWIQKEKMKNGSYAYVGLQWIFYADGSSRPLSSANENQKGSPSMLNMESSSKGEWTFNHTDSTLKICAVCVFKIKKVARDTVFMSGKGYKGDFILVKHR